MSNLQVLKNPYTEAFSYYSKAVCYKIIYKNGLRKGDRHQNRKKKSLPKWFFSL